MLVYSETAAVYRLLDLMQMGLFEFVASEMLVLEATLSSASEKQNAILEALAAAKRHVAIKAWRREQSQSRDTAPAETLGTRP